MPATMAMAIEGKETSRVVRAPKMIREKRSRPNLSVPINNSPEGGAIEGPSPTLKGSLGAMTEAKAARMTRTETSTTPTHSSVLRDSHARGRTAGRLGREMEGARPTCEL